MESLRLSRPYEAYASVYDRTGQSRFGLKMLIYARDLWGGTFPGAILDLGCGTGTVAVALALRGVSVVGLDRSAQMLEEARSRARRWGADVEFREGDFRNLDLPDRFDAVTCFYDAINYCQSVAELESVLTGLARCVRPGGRLIFDAITHYGIRFVWGSRPDLRVDDDLVRVWRPSYDREAGLGTLDITYFVRDEDRNDTWRRFDERHVHRGFDPVEVKAALQATGWDPAPAYRCFSLEPPDAATDRVAYLARRR